MTRRIVVSYLSLTLFVLLLLEVPLAILYAQRERERVESGLFHDASVLAAMYEDSLEWSREPDSAVADRYTESTGARVVVVDRLGEVLVDSAGEIGRDFATRPEVADALSGVRSAGTRYSDSLGVELQYVATPVSSGGVVHGAIRLTISTAAVTDRIHTYWWSMGAVGAIILVVVGLIGWATALSITKPIRSLRETVERFAGGDLDVEGQPVGGPPEIRELAETTEDMARRLSGILSAQRAFVADASHQLRTPLTAIRLRLENLQEALPQDRRLDVAATLLEVDRLSVLVGDLLRLERSDAAGGSAPKAVVDLSEAVEQRVDTWRAVAETRHVTIRTLMPEGRCRVLAADGAVEQILDNLIDNAIEASPEHSDISIEIEPTPGACLLRVVDQGPGLTDEEKRRAVERFWRGARRPRIAPSDTGVSDTGVSDTGPSEAGPGQGTGLGLAIVKALAEASGGGLEFADATSGGLVAIVEFVRYGSDSGSTDAASDSGG